MKIPPQTRAEMIGKYGCLAMCYINCFIEPDTASEYIRIVSDAIDAGVLEEDCTVSDATKFIKWLTGKTYSIEKKDITSIRDIKNKTPVRFDNNGFAHWVNVENGEIVFNSLLNSVCVAKGRPTTARIIKY